ncbi:MAG: bifunctional 4-hydroxy-2-oxoglutarate aldolase/2-dehydro-3-deoxy-phosphogluconate aldolase [Psychrosphaera sp.]|nr:bifunctional 4-hydroxy-2-oxoglutarate aldolase/2-dehydro-3-deoxy-phosphogluconate aldolase [Psychrosphaera sp.]
MDIRQIMDASPVMPVLVIQRIEDAVPLARALYNGGLTVLEITLRTPVALEAITAIKEQLPDAIVGAGTVIDAKTLKAAAQAGSQFFVSPGVNEGLLAAAKDSDIPLLPGVATPSEAMKLYELGYSALKFFPAEAAGGTPMLKSIGGPLPQLAFCPTGGVNPENAPSYLALPNVRCVGGSWMAPEKLIREQQWAQIEAMAKVASQLKQGA